MSKFTTFIAISAAMVIGATAGALVSNSTDETTIDEQATSSSTGSEGSESGSDSSGAAADMAADVCTPTGDACDALSVCCDGVCDNGVCGWCHWEGGTCNAVNEPGCCPGLVCDTGTCIKPPV